MEDEVEERNRFEKNMERMRAQRRKEAKQSPPSYEDSQRMEAAKKINKKR